MTIATALKHLMSDKTITFIGGGNMARSLINGIIQDNNAVQLSVVDPDENQLDAIRQNWPSVATYTDTNITIAQSDVIIFAVKPQIMQTVVEDIASLAQQYQPLCISIAAGITEAKIALWLGGSLPIVRCMPNTPALVQSGATGLFANTYVSNEQRDLAESILRAVGITLWLEQESLLDAVTALSGSGPAYFFLVMEAMQAAAEKMGIASADARLLTLQTAFGAAKLALESSDKPAQLRKNVTSKGGTTEAALKELMDGGLVELFDTALQAAEQRAKQLAQ